MKWRGVIPAMTTAFNPDLSVDHAFVAKHARWLVDDGCAGIVALGSLGESATLRFEEKVAILMECFATQRGKRWFDAETFEALMRLRAMECNSLSRRAEAFYGRKVVV